MSSTESTKLSLHHLSPNGPFDGSQLLYHFFLVAFIEYAVILNHNQKAALPRKKKDSERKKFEQQEIIKTRQGK